MGVPPTRAAKRISHSSELGVRSSEQVFYRQHQRQPGLEQAVQRHSDGRRRPSGWAHRRARRTA